MLRVEENHRWTRIHTDHLCSSVWIDDLLLQGGSPQCLDPGCLLSRLTHA
jgi:hypothetical protein